MTDLFNPLAPREIELRQYQLDGVADLRAAIRAIPGDGNEGGGANGLFVCPTGGGKTVVAAHLLKECHSKGRRAVFIADRITLIDQTSSTLDYYGIPHGVIQGDHPRYEPSRRIQVASAQTLARRKFPPDLDLIIVDEAHTIQKVVAEEILKRKCVCIGLTATPFTKGLGKLYDATVNVTTTNKLIADGFLSTFEIWAPAQPDMTGVKVIAGEWEEAGASKAALQVVGDVVAEYMKLANGRKFISSACDVVHAEEIARQFNEAGIRCAAYTYKTGEAERAELVKEFRKPDSKIRGLVSPVALTKGFDVADVSCVIMARPLRSALAEHIQLFGRGLRIHPDKDKCVILDLSGNCERFLEDWTAFFEHGALELDNGKRKKDKAKAQDPEDRAYITCPSCKFMHPKRPTCPACGHEYPRKAAIQHVAGTLKELVKSGNANAMTDLIWPQVCGYVRQHDKTGGDQERMSKKALALYKQMTGVWPRGNFASTEPAEVTREVGNKIRSMQIAWARGRAQRVAA